MAETEESERVRERESREAEVERMKTDERVIARSRREATRVAGDQPMVEQQAEAEEQ